MRFQSLFISALLFGALTGQLFANDPPTPTPVSTVVLADTGTIVNTVATEPLKIGAWVARSESTAIAVRIYEDGTIKKAKIRRYELVDGEFSDVTTKFKKSDGSETAPVAVFETTLVLKAGYANTYELMYPVEATPVRIGYIRFYKGNQGRTASSAAIRLEAAVVVGATNPCDEPPIDDIGEEEFINATASSAPSAAIPGFKVAPETSEIP